MRKADRDRLVTWKKANDKVLAQREAAAELQVTVRHVKRMLKAWRRPSIARVDIEPQNQPSSARRGDPDSRPLF